jgi:CRP-like cAMP-binding protein
VAAGSLVAPLLVAGLGLRPALVLAGLVPVALAAGGLAMLPSVDADAERARRVLGPRVALLERLRLLEDASPATLERLAAAIVEERLPARSVVLRQGDPADNLFILVEGTVTVDRVDDAGLRHLAELAAPDHVGEIGLVRHAPRNATVATSSNAVLWRLPGSVFLDAVDAAPALSPVLAARINRRLAVSDG